MNPKSLRNNNLESSCSFLPCHLTTLVCSPRIPANQLLCLLTSSSKQTRISLDKLLRSVFCRNLVHSLTKAAHLSRGSVPDFSLDGGQMSHIELANLIAVLRYPPICGWPSQAVPVKRKSSETNKHLTSTHRPTTCRWAREVLQGGGIDKLIYATGRLLCSELYYSLGIQFTKESHLNYCCLVKVPMER